MDEQSIRARVLAAYEQGPEAMAVLVAVLVAEAVAEAVAPLTARVSALEAENAALRAKLAVNSHNSSKPPSTDGLSRKPHPKSLRETTGRHALDHPATLTCASLVRPTNSCRTGLEQPALGTFPLSPPQPILPVVGRRTPEIYGLVLGSYCACQVASLVAAEPTGMYSSYEKTDGERSTDCWTRSSREWPAAVACISVVPCKKTRTLIGCFVSPLAEAPRYPRGRSLLPT